MEAYFAFTDECGNYQKFRTPKSNKDSPFYVRSTIIISLSDYLRLQQGMDNIKASLGLQPNIEVKWSHFGSALKKKPQKNPPRINSGTIKRLLHSNIDPANKVRISCNLLHFDRQCHNTAS